MSLSELVERVFGPFIRLHQSHFHFFEERLKEKSFKARETMLDAGNVERCFYLVKRGVQCLYLINGKGEKVILGFSFTGSVSGGYDSFVLKKPSHLVLESITESTLFCLSRADFDDLLTRFPEFYVWRAHFIESVLFGRLSREREFMTLSARDRYVAFMKRCPEELLQIPQKYLASYLGMKPETFSRLRAGKLL